MLADLLHDYRWQLRDIHDDALDFLVERFVSDVLQCVDALCQNASVEALFPGTDRQAKRLMGTIWDFDGKVSWQGLNKNRVQCLLDRRWFPKPHHHDAVRADSHMF